MLWCIDCNTLLKKIKIVYMILFIIFKPLKFSHRIILLYNFCFSRCCYYKNNKKSNNTNSYRSHIYK